MNTNKTDKRLKGCTNPNCEHKFLKVKYKATDNYCSKCGNDLSFVCKSCLEPFNSKNILDYYCDDCKLIFEDRKQKRKERRNSIGSLTKAALIAAPVALAKAPKVLKSLSKTISNETVVTALQKGPLLLTK